MKLKLNIVMMPFVCLMFAGNVQANNCEVRGASLKHTQTQFFKRCPGTKLKDCDPIGRGRWMCSGRTLGKNSGSAYSKRNLKYFDRLKKKVSQQSSKSSSSKVSSSLNVSSLDRTLSKRDQTPGGKKISRVSNRPKNFKIHRTGVARYNNLKNGTEIFQVNTGLGYRRGFSKTSRSEGYFAYPKGTKGKTFSAHYRVLDSENVTIFQQKGNRSPSIRVSLKNGKNLLISTGDGKPRRVAQIKPNSVFYMKVQDLGKRSRITVRNRSNALLGSLIVKNTRHGTRDNKQFRYGAYTQKGEKSNVSVIVRNARVK